MSLPEFTKRLIDKRLTVYCERKVPVHVRDKVQLTFRIQWIKPSTNFDRLLEEVDSDPTGIFWG